MLFVAIMAILIPLSFLLIKTLNLMLLGDGYARNLGLNIKRARLLVITSAGVLTAIVTAYCGPVIFLGLAVPHLCRAIFQTSDHRVLMPAVLFAGAALALVCNLVAPDARLRRGFAGQFGDCPNRCSGSGLRSIP